MFQPLSEGLETLSRYVAEPVHVDVDLKVVRALHHNKYTCTCFNQDWGASRISEFEHVDGDVRKHEWLV